MSVCKSRFSLNAIVQLVFLYFQRKKKNPLYKFSGVTWIVQLDKYILLGLITTQSFVLLVTQMPVSFISVNANVWISFDSHVNTVQILVVCSVAISHKNPIPSVYGLRLSGNVLAFHQYNQMGLLTSPQACIKPRWFSLPTIFSGNLLQ